MLSKRLSQFMAMAVLVVSTFTLLTASFDAEARRMGGGKSFGRQSSNVTQQRQAVQPPAANTNRNAATPANANAARGGAAAAAPKSGFSRFLGPIAGLAAGLGIAALLSSLGLGGAMLEALSRMLLIGLVISSCVVCAGGQNQPPSPPVRPVLCTENPPHRCRLVLPLLQQRKILILIQRQWQRLLLNLHKKSIRLGLFPMTSIL